VRARFAAMPLEARLILYFTLLISVPLLSVSITNHRLFSRFIEDLVVRQKRELGELSLDQVELLRARDEASSDEILFSRAVQERLTGRPFATGLERYTALRAFEPILAGIEKASDAVGILLVAADGEAYRSNESIGRGPDLPRLAEILGHPRLAASRGANVWIPLGCNALQVMPDDPEAPYLYLARRLNDLSRVQRSLGYSIIQFRTDRFAAILRRAAAGPGEWCVLADAADTVLWDSRDPGGAGRILDLVPTGEPRRGPRGDLLLLVGGEPAGWKLVLSVPAGNLREPSRRMQRITGALIALFLASAIALAIMLSRSITGPIGRLSQTMRRFGSGELALRNGRTRGDEIGRLQESFDHMAGEIEHLLAAVEEEHRQRRKLELDVLEEQINPHFLYNILDSLNWMAQRAGQHELGGMVAALARFFRIGLSGGRDMITVGDELEHARNYLLLSRMRFGDCFAFAFEVEEGVERLRTPKIVLQPLLENAISHGLDKTSREGELRVRCRTEGGDLVFAVEDNGRGIAPERLELIRRRIERGEDEPEYEGGIGLVNVSRRIRLHYGDGYGLTIESAPGRGTTVTVRIPRRDADAGDFQRGG